MYYESCTGYKRTRFENKIISRSNDKRKEKIKQSMKKIKVTKQNS